MYKMKMAIFSLMPRFEKLHSDQQMQTSHNKCGYLRIKKTYIFQFMFIFFHVPSMILGHEYSLSV